jgi:hypothetical protein
MNLCDNPVTVHSPTINNPESMSFSYDHQLREDNAMIHMARLFTVLLFTLASTGALAAGTAARVVVVVWDGMRPDCREFTPEHPAAPA